MCKATTLVELDEPTVKAVRKEVKSLFLHEFQFLVGLGACLAVTLSGLSYYFSTNYQMGQSLPAIAGICGIMILTYVTVSSPKKREKT
jgi:hypothetical protein